VFFDVFRGILTDLEDDCVVSSYTNSIGGVKYSKEEGKEVVYNNL